jgi:hypothetical protein
MSLLFYNFGLYLLYIAYIELNDEYIDPKYIDPKYTDPEYIDPEYIAGQVNDFKTVRIFDRRA